MVGYMSCNQLPTLQKTLTTILFKVMTGIRVMYPRWLSNSIFKTATQNIIFFFLITTADLPEIYILAISGTFVPKQIKNILETDQKSKR